MGKNKGKDERRLVESRNAEIRLHDALSGLWRRYAEPPELEELSRQPNTDFVPGAGYHFPRAIFVGEAPGSNENRQQLPFVGASGRVLTKYLTDNDLRREVMWITNAVKYWPRDEKGRTRAPDSDEIAAGSKSLFSELRLLAEMFPLVRDPHNTPQMKAAPLLVLLGRTAIHAVNPRRGFGVPSVTSIRGQVLMVNVNGIYFDVYCTYHPSALRSNDIKSKFGQDMAAIAAEIRRRERTGYYGNR